MSRYLGCKYRSKATYPSKEPSSVYINTKAKTETWSMLKEQTHKPIEVSESYLSLDNTLLSVEK